LDNDDSLKEFRQEFKFPKTPGDQKTTYLCGNSLGLQPKGTAIAVANQLDKWSAEAVEGHFVGNNLL
jgi:kynureninase